MAAASESFPNNGCTRAAILQNTRVVEGLVGAVAQGTLVADDAAIEANHAETAAEEARAAALRAASYAEAARLTVCPTNLLNLNLILYGT